MTKGSILITGCSTGIGLHAAETLQARGYEVFATARKLEDVEKLKSLGLNSIQLDLASPYSIESALQVVLERTGGRLDYLFNNGAYGQPGAIEDLPTQALKEQFETNVFGWHHLTRLVIKVMREQGHGRIVQNSSVLGIVSMPLRGAYNASKYAIEGLTDTLRLELAGSDIHAILIEPGPILTKFRANALAALKRNINIDSSYHEETYKNQIARLEKKEAAIPFTLGPEAVTKALIHSLESQRPKARYRVTFPTVMFAVLKRLLTTKWLDRVLLKG